MAVISVGRKAFDQALRGYAAAGMAEEDLAALEWLWGYAFGALGGDADRTAAAVGYERTTVYRVFKGIYQGNLANFMAAVHKTRKRLDGQIPAMIVTPVTRKIDEALDYARDFNAMVILRGPTGRGKTYVAKDWSRRNNHGRAPYVRCTAGMTKNLLLRMLAKAVGVGSHNKNNSELTSQIMGALDRRHTLIVDEAGHLIPRGRRRSTIPMDILRDIHDHCGCGLVLIVTNVYWNEIVNGALSEFFEQFLGRVRYNLAIPDHAIYKAEIEAICRAFAGEHADKEMIALAGDIAKRDGGHLRMLFTDLQNASRHANRKGLPLTAAMLAKARAWRLSAGAWNEDTI